MRVVLFFICLSMLGNAASIQLKEGSYRGVIVLNESENRELPFNIEVKYKGKRPIIIFRNADEKIVVDEITVKGDSINFKMPVFDTEFRTKIEDGNWSGVWINHYKTSNNILTFKTEYNETRRFKLPEERLAPDFEGNWETTFSPNSDKISKAIGVFHHVEQSDFLSGTFLTETGDYRYLEGMRSGNQLYLSCFDGNHAYLFTAKYDGKKLIGDFYSGSSYHEAWEAVRNENFKLGNADEITFMKDKNAVIQFSFPNISKQVVSLSDKKYAGKVTIIQVMGSWCPNCMDESVYLSELYKQYNNKGLEIIGLAFEKTNDFETSSARLKRLKERLKIEYELLVTQQTGKEKASEVLSALNNIVAFPTTLYLNKQHQVVKIHTGFSGPATGKAYEEFKQSTEKLIQKLLQE